MIQHEDSHDLFTRPEDDAPAPDAAPLLRHEIRLPSPDAGEGAIGGQLRAARTALGLGLAECAERLRLPVKVLERLEADDLGSPDQFVFMRGPLTSYARLLGVNAEACNRALRVAAPTTQPALTSVAKVSHARWLLQRYGTATTYIVLTAFIAVPLVLLGLRGGLDRPAARIVSLDQAPAASATRHGVTATPDATPFRASMAPFAAMGLSESSTAGDVPVAPAPIPAAVTGQHTLTISATQDCWFEITGADGSSVDSGLLHAGDSRTWHATGELHVTLGNADSVSVVRDGQPVALDGYRRANVARFDVFGTTEGNKNN